MEKERLRVDFAPNFRVWVSWERGRSPSDLGHRSSKLELAQSSPHRGNLPGSNLKLRRNLALPCGLTVRGFGRSRLAWSAPSGSGGAGGGSKGGERSSLLLIHLTNIYGASSGCQALAVPGRQEITLANSFSAPRAAARRVGAQPSGHWQRVPASEGFTSVGKAGREASHREGRARAQSALGSCSREARKAEPRPVQHRGRPGRCRGSGL